jgi:hypothetical protein
LRAPNQVTGKQPIGLLNKGAMGILTFMALQKKFTLPNKRLKQYTRKACFDLSGPFG